MLTVDYYKEDDFYGICELMKYWGEDCTFSENIMRQTISAITKSSDYKLIVAKNDNKIAGYAQTGKCIYLGFESFIEIIQLLVSDENRSSGIGSLLLRFIEDEAINENINLIKLNSQIQRSKAHVFYENRGYSLFKVSKFYEKKLNY